MKRIIDWLANILENPVRLPTYVSMYDQNESDNFLIEHHTESSEDIRKRFENDLNQLRLYNYDPLLSDIQDGAEYLNKSDMLNVCYNPKLKFKGRDLYD